MRWLLFLLLAPLAFAQAVPFALLDANGDGKLTRAELPEPLRPHFGLADANRDGFVSQSELTRALSGQPAPAPSIPAGIEHVKDVDYVGKNNPRQKLDLLLPGDRLKKRPLVVFVHGGGWISGSKEDGLGVARQIVDAGDYVVATINYRLATEAIWPAQIHDCKAAIRFLRGNAAKYGIDPERIGVMGMSAGGHLVAMLGTTGGVDEMEGNLGNFPAQSSRVRCVVNFFGPANFLSFLGPEASVEKLMRDFTESRLLGRDADQVKRNAVNASPVQWITRDDAPFLTAHGTRDGLVPFAQSQELDRALTKSGVESHLIAMEGADHGFESPELNRRIKLFLGKHLRDTSAEIPNSPIRVR